MEDPSHSHMRNLAAEQAHNLEVERLKEVYEEIEEFDCGLVVTSMKYETPKGIFKKVTKDV